MATFYNCSLNGIDDNNNSLYEPPHSVTIPSVSSGEIPLHACCEIQVRSTYTCTVHEVLLVGVVGCESISYCSCTTSSLLV